jgi:uncharacterized NAD(P)/FAD-binding protein YdhS
MTVAIVGGGCAGALVAAHLMREDRRPRRIVIFEPGPALAAGVAYGTDDPRHLLNAPASSMSAFEDEPSHFVTWLADRGLGYGPTDFVARHLYRTYLQAVLGLGQHRVGATELVWIPEKVTAVRMDDKDGRGGATIHYGGGQQCRADSVVLALGAPASAAAPVTDLVSTGAIIRDPWEPGRLAALPTTEDVLILGTGLTMIDVALVLADGAPERVVHARSRHGLLPAEHTSDGFAPWPGFDIGRPTTARDVLSRLRQAVVEAEATGWNWRNVIAAARGAAPEVWRGLSEPERRRLLRHLGRKWDVSRHRMSTPVAATIGRLRASARLDVGAGRIVSVAPHGSAGDARLRVEMAGPGGRRETLVVGAIIDCTGPGSDPTQSSPLIARLAADGLACMDPSGIGLDVDEDGDLRTFSGPSTAIHTIGWCRRGAEFESNAVPEIRRQADRLARRLTAPVVRNRAVLVPA